MYFIWEQNPCFLLSKTKLKQFLILLAKINRIIMDNRQEIIEKAWGDRAMLQNAEVVKTIEGIIEDIDKGRLRCAEPLENGWQVNEWVKKAVILYFPPRKMETIEAGPLECHDKIP